MGTHPPQSSAETQAPWIRIPASGERCKHTGLARGTFLLLLQTAGKKITSVRIGAPGSKRPARLISLPSILSYLAILAEEQQVGAEFKVTGDGAGTHAPASGTISTPAGAATEATQW